MLVQASHERLEGLVGLRPGIDQSHRLTLEQVGVNRRDLKRGREWKRDQGDVGRQPRRVGHCPSIRPLMGVWPSPAARESPNRA